MEPTTPRPANEADRLTWNELTVMANNTVRYSRNGGATWTYALIGQPRGSGGVPLWNEVQDGVDSRQVVREEDFENPDFIVEGARGVAGKRWSYKGVLWS